MNDLIEFLKISGLSEFKELYEYVIKEFKNNSCVDIDLDYNTIILNNVMLYNVSNICIEFFCNDLLISFYNKNNELCNIDYNNIIDIDIMF